MELYASRMEKYGGVPSAPKHGCLEGCLGNAWTTESYNLAVDDEEEDAESEYPRPGLVFAAYLLFYLTNDHCFADGNKRLGWSAMTYVLALHDLTVDASIDEAEEFMLAVASGKAKQGDVMEWIAERLVSPQ